MENQQWNKEVVRNLDLDPSMLPEVLRSVDPVGTIRSDVSKQTELPPSTTVVAGGADTACSAVGSGIVDSGLVSASIGTSGTIVAHTNSMRRDSGGRIHSFNHAVPDRWYLMGVMLSAAGSLNWYQDHVDPRDVDPRTLDQEADSVPPGSDGIIFLPYLNGERTPHRNARARGVFFGLSSTHTHRHMTRAVMEGVAYGLRDSLELIRNLGVEPTQIRATGGGAKSPFWRQVLADVFGETVVTMKVEEGPAFGASLIAAVGAKHFNSVAYAVETGVRTAEQITPKPRLTDRYDEYYDLFQSLYASLSDQYETLHDLVNQYES